MNNEETLWAVLKKIPRKEKVKGVVVAILTSPFFAFFWYDRLVSAGAHLDLAFWIVEFLFVACWAIAAFLATFLTSSIIKDLKQ